jgi:hypothetical protein
VALFNKTIHKQRSGKYFSARQEAKPMNIAFMTMISRITLDEIPHDLDAGEVYAGFKELQEYIAVHGTSDDIQEAHFTEDGKPS